MTKISTKSANNIIRSSTQFGSMTLVSRITGFIRDILFANYFGANSSTDAFFVAFKIPNFFRRLFAEGAFSQAFIPVLQEYKIHKTNELKEFVQNIFGNLFIVLLLVTILGVVYAKEIVYVFAPGFTSDPELSNLASSMLEITFPYLLFISLTAMCTAIFNSHNRFILSGITPVFLNLSLIIFTIFGSTLFIVPIVSLSYGVFVAGIIQLTIQLPLLYKLGYLRIPKINFNHFGSLRVVKLMGPAIIGSAAVQINLLIDTIVASLLVTGSISWLYFSDRLIELPLAIFGIAISIVILPILSSQYQQDKSEEYAYTLRKSIKLASVIAIPSMIGLIILSGAIISTLFMYGSFDLLDVEMTTLSLITYSLGLPAFIFLKILVTGFYSRQDTKSPVIYSLIGILFNIVANLSVLYVYLNYPFSGAHALVALATSLSAWIQVLLMTLKLKKVGIITTNIFLNKVMLKMLVASLIMGLAIYSYGNIFPHDYKIEYYHRALSLIIDITLAAIIYIFMLKIMKERFLDYKI